MATNWAGNHTYATSAVLRPRSLRELAEAVAAGRRVRAIGSGHSFTDLSDAGLVAAQDSRRGVLVSLEGLPRQCEIDQVARTATVGAAARYGEVARSLHEAGWALSTMASLPHISVAGAVSTGTHGSGVAVRSLAGSVAALTLLGPDGRERRVARGDADFDGTVVGLGALGIVTSLSLDIEPAYDVRQDAYDELTAGDVLPELEPVLGTAYSVSVFTDFGSGPATHVVLKSRGGELAGPPEVPAVLRGARRATETVHPIRGLPAEAVTEQLGVPGPWHERLPHFRAEFTPSVGAELQSEYLVPSPHAATAFERLMGLRATIGTVLRVAEVRTVAAEPLWLSPSYGTDVTAFHFTWALDEPGVYGVLPPIEDALLPLGARPHWGKCFVADAAALRQVYPRLADFRALRERVDPDGTFVNPFMERVLG